MVYVDPNITFSPEICNLAVGASAGFLGAMGFIFNIIWYIIIVILGLSLIKRLPEIITSIKLKVRSKKK